LVDSKSKDPEMLFIFEFLNASLFVKYFSKMLIFLPII